MALVHFQAAADMGYGEAQLILADFYSKGLTGSPKLDLAQRYANLALKTNYAKAKKKLDELEASQKPPVDPIPDVPVTNTQVSQELAANEALLPEPTLLAPSTKLNEDNFNSAMLPSPYEPRKEMGKTKSNPPASLEKRNLKDESISIPKDSKVIEMAKNYYWGRSVERNYPKAFQLFLKSAKAGNAESSRYLGLIYLSGNGVPKDLKESIKWFERASSLGDDMATKHLKKLKILSND
jgi:TPR repeat protein